MKSPFQQEIALLIARYEAQKGVRVTGQLLGELTQRSRNHLSNIMNDGLVPSAEAVAVLCRVLEATQSESMAILMAGLRTKSEGPRQLHWLQESVRLIDQLEDELSAQRRYLEEQGLWEQFQKQRRSEK